MKILVRATNWLGDAVIAIPALQAIRRRWPQAEIVLLARAAVAQVYGGQSYINRTIVWGDSNSGEAAAQSAANLEALIAERFDCAVLLQNAFSAAWLAWRAKIPERIGYARDARSLLLTRAVPVPKSGAIPSHEAYYYLALLRGAGWIRELPEIEEIMLCIPGAAADGAEQRLRACGVPANVKRVALAPGASYGSAKCWPPERYAAAADRLIAEFGVNVILFGTASDREISERISARMQHQPVNLTGKTSTAELAALFSCCDVFLGNDSGAMHLAAAAGIPVVAVFGPTDAAGTAPMTKRRSLVRHEVSCSPCFLRACPVDHRCMERIEIEQVYRAVSQWLESAARA